MTEATIEGRLLALRQVVAMLVAGKDADAVLEHLTGTMRDGQEDPGAVPSQAVALQGAIAEEKRMLAREIRLRLGR